MLFIEMPKKYAVVIGIEKYREAGLDSVAYATGDATEFASALKQLGHDERNIVLLLNEHATATTIKYECRQMAKTAEEHDQLSLFFAGHGYTAEGHNYLLAYDTRRGDLRGTSVPLQQLLGYFAESAADQIACFLDCCHSGMKLGDEERGVLEQLSEDELKDFFQNAEYRVVFSACSPDEKSYPSLKYKHGYWTYHLLRAFRGEEHALLDKRGRLLSSSLQDYLALEVPKQVKLQSTERRSQHPKMYGDLSNTFVVADLHELLQRKNAELALRRSGLKDFTFQSSEQGPVRALGGFLKEKGHKAPKFVSRTTQTWVAKIATDDITAELKTVFDTIRGSRAYKSRDIEYDEPVEGSGAVRTPDFEFVVTYEQSSEDPASYIVTRQLNRLSEPNLVAEDWFNDVFSMFDEVVLQLSAPVDVRAFIDKAEEVEFIEIDCNPDRTECRIRSKRFAGIMIVSADSLTYSSPNKLPIRDLIAYVEEAHIVLAAAPVLTAMLPES